MWSSLDINAKDSKLTDSGATAVAYFYNKQEVIQRMHRKSFENISLYLLDKKDEDQMRGVIPYSCIN